MPAALNQNPLLTLDALAHCGCVLPTEVQAALDVSLTLKARELGVQAFLFWGRLNTLSGKDYYIARAYNGTKRVDGKLVVNPGNKFYYSRDGLNWLDLEPVSEETTERASKLDCACALHSSSLPRRATRARFRGAPHARSREFAHFWNRAVPSEPRLPCRADSLDSHRLPSILAGWLTGDPSHVFEVAQPVPEPEPKEELPPGDEPADEEGAEEEEEEAEPLPPWEITEAEYAMCRINAINAAAALAPEDMFVTDPHGNHVPNPQFHVSHPEQLSSYAGPDGNLGRATPGKWGIRRDSIKGLTVIRNFEYPGFFAYYSEVSNTVGNLYFGNGLKNQDLAFAA